MKILKHGKMKDHIFTCKDFEFIVFQADCPECGTLCMDTETIEKTKG